MSYEIVTDSMSNLTEEMIDSLGVQVISLIFRVGDMEYHSYEKGKHADVKKFYELMRKGEKVATSQITAQSCSEMFESILKKDRDVLFVGFSSALSGSYNAAQSAAQELREEYPERKIVVIDSLSGALAEGLLVRCAAQQKNEGKSLEDVAQWLTDNRLTMSHWFTVDDLIHLQRGGRVSMATALVGTVLGIKPILHMDDNGRMVPVGKVRGRLKSIETLVDRMEETCVNPGEQTVAISHADCLEDAKTLERLVRERLHPKDIIINFADPVVGAHTGPGALGLFFFGSKR